MSLSVNMEGWQQHSLNGASACVMAGVMCPGWSSTRSVHPRICGSIALGSCISARADHIGWLCPSSTRLSVPWPTSASQDGLQEARVAAHLLFALSSRASAIELSLHPGPYTKPTQIQLGSWPASLPMN